MNIAVSNLSVHPRVTSTDTCAGRWFPALEAGITPPRDKTLVWSSTSKSPAGVVAYSKTSSSNRSCAVALRGIRAATQKATGTARARRCLMLSWAGFEAPPLERHPQRHSHGARNCGMEMNVLDAFCWLALQARREEVVDVGYFRVEEIEAFRHQSNPIGELVPCLAV